MADRGDDHRIAVHPLRRFCRRYRHLIGPIGGTARQFPFQQGTDAVIGDGFTRIVKAFAVIVIAGRPDIIAVIESGAEEQQRGDNSTSDQQRHSDQSSAGHSYHGRTLRCVGVCGKLCLWPPANIDRPSRHSCGPHRGKSGTGGRCRYCHVSGPGIARGGPWPGGD